MEQIAAVYICVITYSKSTIDFYKGNWSLNLSWYLWSLLISIYQQRQLQILLVLWGVSLGNLICGGWWAGYRSATRDGKGWCWSHGQQWCWGCSACDRCVIGRWQWSWLGSLVLRCMHIDLYPALGRHTSHFWISREILQHGSIKAKGLGRKSRNQEVPWIFSKQNGWCQSCSNSSFINWPKIRWRAFDLSHRAIPLLCRFHIWMQHKQIKGEKLDLYLLCILTYSSVSSKISSWHKKTLADWD